MDSLRDGGAEKILVDILNQFPKNEFDVELKLIRLQGPHLERINPDIRLSYIRKDKKGLYAKFIDRIIGHLNANLLYRIFIHGKYDIVVAFMEGPSTKIISGGTHNIQKIGWVHSDLLRNNWIKYFCKSEKQHRKCYEKLDKIVCVSEGVREAFIKRFGFVEKIIVRHNPVDAEDILKKSQNQFDLDYSDEYINAISAGRFVEQKAFDKLIHIVEKLQDEGIKIRLYLLGTGIMETELKAYVDLHHISDKIIFLGFQENPYPYLKAANIYICSSIAEGYSTTVTEAVVLGLPVITTDCAGMYELLGNNEYGIITDNTEEALYYGLLNLLSNRDKFDFYKSQALARSKQLRNNNNIDSIISIFRDEPVRK